MAKYYLTSGNIEFIVTAMDAEGAALWMINQIVDQVISPSDEFNASDSASELIDYVEALDVFDDQILVSEIGFGRDDVGVLETEVLFMHWFQLSNALNHLLDRLDS